MQQDRPTPADWTILHGGALGDLVLTLQLALRIEGISEAARIHVVSRTDPGGLSNCAPRITRQSTEGIGLHWLFGEDSSPPPKALAELVARRRILNACAGRDSQPHRRLAALAPRELWSFDPRPLDRDERHITEQWCAALAADGLRFAPVPLGLTRDGSAVRAGRARLQALCRSTVDAVVVHPGSGGMSKCWPIASYAELCRRIRTAGMAVVCIIGPAEVERFPPNEVQSVRAAATELAVAPPATVLTEMLAACEAYIGNDSGPTHLAALLGTPVVALFGPTSPAVWRPLGRHVRVLTGNIGIGDAGWGLKPAEVFAAVAGLLRRP